MKKILLILASSVFASAVYAATPYIAVPDLVYENGVKNWGINNTDIKGAIIKSGKYKVMNTPKNFNVAAAIETIKNRQDAEEAAANAPKEEHDVKVGNSIVSKQDKRNPTYILLGEVVTADLHDNYYKLQGTDSSTGTRTLNVSVNYNLMDLEDNSVISSFNVSATGTQTAVLNQSYGSVKLQTNQGNLIRETSQDLAKQVIQELTAGNVETSKGEEEKAPLVKNFTTYN